MSILVTGAAGFIGFHVANALLERGERVVGIDNLNEYYDVRLKEARLARLRAFPGFEFAKLDVADRDGVFTMVERHKDLLAAGSLLAANYEEFLSGARELRVIFEPDEHTCLHQYAWTRDRLLLVTLADVASRVAGREIARAP